MWARIESANNNSLGLPTSNMYKYFPKDASPLHDVTAGNNGYNGFGYNAGAGYDMTTGWGSLDISKFNAYVTKYWGGAPAPAPTPSGVNIVAASSGLCLNVASNSQGAGVIQSPCASTGNELWKLVPVGSYYHIVAQGSGQCLNVPGYSTTQGTQLIQWTCQSSSSTNDQWSLVAVGSRYHLVSRSSGLCVNIDGGSNSSGAKVIQWACQTEYTNDQFTY
jgi:hypothetical protein